MVFTIQRLYAFTATNTPHGNPSGGFMLNRMFDRGGVAALLLLICTAPALAQGRRTPPDTTKKDTTAVRMTPIVVTATRAERSVFETPTPVSVLNLRTIQDRSANTVGDLFRGVAGLDVTGVGTNQVRPVIRGQRGQRVLMLEDGLRLNNSRRQQDFGELPALVDITSAERVEIVRGPASVLYGSDAIGGVVNVITERPRLAGLHGSAGYRFSSYDDQQHVTGAMTGRFGRLSMLGRGTFRTTNSYMAPAGTYGDITLAKDTRVNDTGVKDYSTEGYLGYHLAPGHDLFARYERYSADSSGFGWVNPTAYAPSEPKIQILYPYQRFNKVSFGYTGIALGLPIADKIDVTGYWQGNRRRLNLNLRIPFDASQLPPGTDSGGLIIDQRNFTNISTIGGRLEVKKLLGSVAALTYGADLFRDASTNTDTNATDVYGFGPSTPDVATQPLVPNASFRSFGAFAQSEFHVIPRTTVILGARYQDVRAATRTTPGLSDAPIVATDRTVVGAANAIVDVTRNVALVGSVGRAFRSPNLIERFFNGPTPEGFGYQAPNAGLKAETSLDVDLGARYRNRYLFAEAFVFQNMIYNGIRIQAIPDSAIGPLPVYQNVNIDRLRARGIEFNGDVKMPLGVSLGGTFTHLNTKDVTQDQNNPIGDSFSSQLSGFLRYDAPGDHFFGEYRVRHNFKRADPELLAGNPIGTTLPAFTTMSARAGVVVLRRGTMSHRLSVGVLNLTNALYAEFSNVSFFRPEPKRSIVLTYDVTF
jgi:outer membrane receptor protein involved in Fe transport